MSKGDGSVDRCACGKRELDSFIGTYNDAEASHTREACTPFGMTRPHTTQRVSDARLDKRIQYHKDRRWSTAGVDQEIALDLRDSRAALGAREADVAALSEALRTAMEMVRTWHGMGMDTVSEQRAWKLYEEGAPEWRPLREVRDRPAGGYETLRAHTERTVEATARRAANIAEVYERVPSEVAQRACHEDCASAAILNELCDPDDPDRLRLVARLLEPRSDTPTTPAQMGEQGEDK